MTEILCSQGGAQYSVLDLTRISDNEYLPRLNDVQLTKGGCISDIECFLSGRGRAVTFPIFSPILLAFQSFHFSSMCVGVGWFPVPLSLRLAVLILLMSAFFRAHNRRYFIKRIIFIIFV